jgi:hypothetical protein
MAFDLVNVPIVVSSAQGEGASSTHGVERVPTYSEGVPSHTPFGGLHTLHGQSQRLGVRVQNAVRPNQYVVGLSKAYGEGAGGHPGH